jgi:ketosteroid isomerase-like protein
MSSGSPIEVARSYYQAWTTNDFDRLSPLLADDLEIEVPINAYDSKAHFLDAVVMTATMTSSVELLAEFGTADEALLLYDMTLPIGSLRVAEHFTVAGGKIRRIRQVHDTVALRAAGFERAEGR